MLSNQIFISHSKEQKNEAEQIAYALRERGYRVFVDTHNLPAGEAFKARIEKAIRDSSALVFLISPQSVADEKYTLSELSIARNKWPHPHRVVLPVMVVPTDEARIPEYLKNVTFLQRHGNLAADVSSAVAKLVPVRSHGKIAAMAGAAVLVLAIMIWWLIQPQYIATARCSETGVIGHGTSSDMVRAEDNAVSDCISLGGIRGCCQVVDVRLK
jgi:hypothetical protein